MVCNKSLYKMTPCPIHAVLCVICLKKASSFPALYPHTHACGRIIPRRPAPPYRTVQISPCPPTRPANARQWQASRSAESLPPACSGSSLSVGRLCGFEHSDNVMFDAHVSTLDNWDKHVTFRLGPLDHPFLGLTRLHCSTALFSQT